MAAYGCLTRMHVVRLLAPRMDSDSRFKDIDFSPAAIRARWKAGLDNMRDVIARAPWNEPFDAMDGCALHEAIGG
jgi:NTE family protein